MKLIQIISFALALASPLSAAYESWTNKEGKTIQLRLLEVTGKGDSKTGVFQMPNGSKATVKATDLSEADAKRLDQWKPVNPSTFDDILYENLVKLEGKELKPYKLKPRPSKYYIFYYTASWCPPCQAFTPSLVKFYNKHKNDKFELVLITSDRDEEAMKGYAIDKKMPWPQLKHSEAVSFKQKFNHGVLGIPSVIVCDLQGKIISSEGRNLDMLEKLVK